MCICTIIIAVSFFDDYMIKSMNKKTCCRKDFKRTLLVRGGIEMDQNRLYYVTPYVKNFSVLLFPVHKIKRHLGCYLEPDCFLSRRGRTTQ